MVQFASYLRRVLCKTRLIFPRINGPIVFLIQICNKWNKRVFCHKNQLVGALISVGDVSVGIAIHVMPYFKTVNWILAAGRVRERYIRKGNKNRNKIELWTWFIFTQYFGSSTRTRKENEHKIQDEIPSIFVFFLYIFFGSLSLP